MVNYNYKRIQLTNSNTWQIIPFDIKYNLWTISIVCNKSKTDSRLWQVQFPDQKHLQTILHSTVDIEGYSVLFDLQATPFTTCIHIFYIFSFFFKARWNHFSDKAAPELDKEINPKFCYTKTCLIVLSFNTINSSKLQKTI